MVKRTYNLPPDIIARMEAAVGPGKRSELVGSLIAEWLDRSRKARLRAEIVQGCREMFDLDLEEAKAFQSADDAQWQ